MRLLWNEVKKYKKILIGALLLATVNQVFSLLDPQIFRMIIDNYASRASSLSQAEFVRGVGLLLLATIGVAFISRVAKAFQDYFVNVIVQRVGTNLYAKSVEHAFALSYAVFEDQRSGELLSKLQKARTDSQQLIGNSVNILFFSLIGVIFVLVYATTVHPVIGLVYFLTIPVLGFATFYLSKKIKEAQSLIVRETASLSGSTTETLRNVELVKSLGLESQEVSRLNEVNEHILKLELRKVRMVRSLDFVQGTLINALRSGLLLLMLWFIFKGDLSIGEFFTLMIYSFFIFAPLGQLGQVATSFQEAKASLAQLAEVLSLKPSPVPKNAKSLADIAGIVYKNVSLKYDNGKVALFDVNLIIKEGETVAFVGPSGSGKSSMVKLLAGLYEPSEGEILFNGINIKELNVAKLRERIGLVAQETQLFAGTVKENLLFVKPNATDVEMLEAIDLAQAKSIFSKTSDSKGLETRIGEGGVKLSGGERQRLAIARALLRNPSLLVFDEATSSLDSITEKSITETIKNLNTGNPGKKSINILVAHRLSTILHANKIYVFEHGKIVEEGSHDYLVGQGGLYSALWREQTAGSNL